MSQLNRRQFVLAGVSGAATLGLAACGGSNQQPAAQQSGSSTASSSSTEKPAVQDEREAPEVDAAAFDALLAQGPVADDATIEKSAWAKAIKSAGKIRIGGTRTSVFFSLENIQDKHLRGFDAGLFQLLARYITGNESNYDLTQVTSDTRESVLTTDQVDAVFATYSILPARQEVINFAGPYYTSQQSILVNKSNTNINALADLAGKNVAVQSGSSGPSIMEEFAPQAKLQQFSTDEEARSALEQGRVDAYVIDNTLHMGNVARNPSKYKIVGEPFGPEDKYGIGLAKSSEGAVEFVNGFLAKIEEELLWQDLWRITIGNRIGNSNPPEPPKIGL